MGDERVPIEKDQGMEMIRDELAKPWGVRRRGMGQSQVKEKPTEAGLALENDATPETPRGVEGQRLGILGKVRFGV